jgi:hypothetical protein
MATLIAVFSGLDWNGKPLLVGYCTARCYKPIDPHAAFRCDCICGGRNHGIGLEKATDQTREHCDDWAEEYAERKKLSSYHYTLGRPVRVQQLHLFDLSTFSQSIAS